MADKSAALRAKLTEKYMADREAAAAPMIGEISRAGQPVFYIWPFGGEYREGTRAELIQYLILNNYA
ncbi:hypothetical protein ACC806_34860 [Rhizobium ruizarguesonis]